MPKAIVRVHPLVYSGPFAYQLQCIPDVKAGIWVHIQSLQPTLKMMAEHSNGQREVTVQKDRLGQAGLEVWH